MPRHLANEAQKITALDASGRATLPPSSIKARDRPRREIVAGDDEVSLTDRERDVLHWASRGKTMAETAIILAISSQTVEGYTRSAIRKLGASNNTQGVVLAIQHGLIDL